MISHRFSCLGHGAKQVKEFLSTFKTQKCAEEKHHDWFQCPFFHRNGVDKRRNPFEVVYFPDEPEVTGTERAYHPINFRTKYCESANCKYGDFCAFAHTEEALRQPWGYEEEMQQKLFPSRPMPQMRDYLPAPQPVAPPAIFRPQKVPDPERFAVVLKLTRFEVKVLQHPKMSLWKQIKDIAIEFMCQIQLEEAEPVALKIQGQEKNAKCARSKCESQLRPMPKKYGETESKKYTERVFWLLSQSLKKDGPERFTDSKQSDLVEINLNQATCEVEVCALNLPKVLRTKNVLTRIDLWIQDCGHDKATKCESCMDEFNPNQGKLGLQGLYMLMQILRYWF